MSKLFPLLHESEQRLTKNFIMQSNDRVREYLNKGAFAELYSMFEKYIKNKGYLEADTMSCLTALLLDAGIEVFGENGSGLIYMNSFNYLKIEEYSVPEGVTRIANESFMFCDDLKEIYLPSPLKSIGEDVFLGCSNLKAIHYDGTYENLKNISYGIRLFPTKTIAANRLFICADGTWNSKGEKIA